jgi:hypothetical protein
MAYGYSDRLAPDYSSALDDYVQTAQAGQPEMLAGLRADATRELDAEILGGDQQGRAAGYQRMSLDQGITDEQDRFSSGLGLKRAELGETMRQRGQQRGWDIADRNERLYQLRKKAEAERKIKEDEARGGLNAEIGGGVGAVVGGVTGGILTSESGGWGAYPGAIGGAAAGGAIGSAI